MLSLNFKYLDLYYAESQEYYSILKDNWAEIPLNWSKH